MTARTTDFIVNGNDYFVANLDNGGVRVGMLGGTCFDFNSSHPLYIVAVAVTNEDQAESLFDHCMDVYGCNCPGKGKSSNALHAPNCQVRRAAA